MNKNRPQILLLMMVIVVMWVPWVWGAGEGSHGVPGVVFYQALNFLLFIGLLFYLLRDKVRAFYQGRYDRFQEQFEASRKEREAMDASYKNYQEKLQEITSTESHQIQKAEQEAFAMKARILANADQDAQQIEREAQVLLDLEYKKLQREIQLEFSKKFMQKIRRDLSTHISPTDQGVLIQQFTEQVSFK